MIRADNTRLRAALEAVQRETRRDGAEIVTRALRNVAFRASQFSPKSNPSKVDSELRRDNILVKLAVSSLKKRQGTFTRAQLKSEMQRIKRAKKSRAGALKASWAKAIEGLGGKFRGARRLSASSANKGFGLKANQAKLEAWGRNTIVTRSTKGGKTTAEQIIPLQRALEQAEEFVAANEEMYAQRKIEQRLRRHSD